MNKNAIQRFALWARKELIAQVSQRAYQYDITADDYGEYDAASVGGRLLSENEKKQRQGLIRQIQSKGYPQVMEEVAYTWFNRFIALRFMEVNNYLPSHIRIFSDASGAFKPEILTDALHLELPGLDMEKVSDLIEKNQTEDLYRYLLLTQCNALSESLPRMFEKMGSYTELLLPNNILRQDGVLGRMVADIPEEDWTDQVQIIGWLYQYYNTELKDDTFALLKKNVKITKERIPSATQLFTPDWIVRYMVENSLGRLWIEGHPDDDLKAGWKYYLDEAEQEPDVQTQLEAIRAEYRTLRPQDIKVIDPCMGSGHILVYAFDVLVQIYKRAGFSERDAAQSILENNLYGLDIDDRAAQLAYFAVMMKARQYDRRIFSRNIQPHVYAIVESNDVHIPAKWRLGTEQDIAEKLVAELKDAKEYGSILNLSLTMDELATLRKRLMNIDEMSNEGNLMDMMESSETFNGLFPLVEVSEVLAQKYEVVVTNPPYMSLSNGNERLNKYAKKNYPITKADLFTICIEKFNKMVNGHGFCSLVTMQSWMFLTGFEKLRSQLFEDYTITSIMHMETMVLGIAFGTAVTVFRAWNNPNYYANFFFVKYKDLNEFGELNLLPQTGIVSKRICDFRNIAGMPIAYWVTQRVNQVFSIDTHLEDSFVSGGRNKTHNDDKYLRYIWEIARSSRWALYAKGGDNRKWYGNEIYAVDWSESARNDYQSHGGLIKKEFWDKDGITWSFITYSANFRYKNKGTIYSSVSPTIFLHENGFDAQTLGFLNSCVGQMLLSITSANLGTNVGEVLRIPWLLTKDTHITELVNSSVEHSKEDWDDFEISWDFETHPIVKKALSRFHCGHEGAITLAYVYKYVAQDFEQRFQKLKTNEEELNRIFINIYDLQDELTPEVEDKDVTVRRADLGRDIRSMISYAVGCMFGRYSLAQWGLAYAGGEWNPGGRGFADYGEFEPDKDNIIPICDDEYFDDDITGRFVKWVEVVFGKETLEENLKFIADALDGKGTPREVIRRYFLNDFYADHLRTYQKRPIYWLFDSGKKNGFKALIYMHRYQSDLLARMRTDYVHEQQERYRTQLKHIGDAMDSASASERVKLAKQQKKLQEQALELQKYEEKVHHLADQNIKIDLDDGVKHNYALFEDVLAKIK